MSSRLGRSKGSRSPVRRPSTLTNERWVSRPGVVCRSGSRDIQTFQSSSIGQHYGELFERGSDVVGLVCDLRLAEILKPIEMSFSLFARRIDTGGSLVPPMLRGRSGHCAYQRCRWLEIDSDDRSVVVHTFLSSKKGSHLSDTTLIVSLGLALEINSHGVWIGRLVCCEWG